MEGRRQSAAVQFGPVRRYSISCLDGAATKVPRLRRSRPSHDNTRKTHGNPLCLLPCRPTPAVAHQCKNRHRHPHCRLLPKHQSRPPKHPSQRDQRLRLRHHPRRRPNPPISKLRQNPLWQRATRAANQKRIHHPRHCHKVIAQQRTRRNGARPSTVPALVRTGFLHHHLCLKVSRQRSASERVSYQRSGDEEVDAKRCTTMHTHVCFFLCCIIPQDGMMASLAL